MYLKNTRSKLSPLGKFISESPILNGKSLEQARSQASKVIFGELDEAAKASKVFKLRASTTNWAKFGRIAGPALTVATQGFIYYTIIRDKPPFKQVQEDFDTPFNPGYWFYRRTVGWWLEGLAD